MACTDLEKAKRDHEAYLLQRLAAADKRINTMENIIAHLLDIHEHGAEPSDWILQQARREARRVRTK